MYLVLSDGSIITLVPLLPPSPTSCKRSLMSEALVSDPLLDLLTHLEKITDDLLATFWGGYLIFVFLAYKMKLILHLPEVHSSKPHRAE